MANEQKETHLYPIYCHPPLHLTIFDRTSEETRECEADCHQRALQIRGIKKNRPPIVGEYGYYNTKREVEDSEAHNSVKIYFCSAGSSSSCGIHFSSPTMINTWGTGWICMGVLMEIN